MKVVRCIFVSVASVLLACAVFMLTLGFFTVTKLLFPNSIYAVLAVASILFCLIVCGFEKIIKEKLKITSRLYVLSAIVIPAIFAAISNIVVQCLINRGYYFSGGLMPGFGEYILTLSVLIVICVALVGKGLLAMALLLKTRIRSRGK